MALTDKMVYLIEQARKRQTVDPSWSDEQCAKVLTLRAQRARHKAADKAAQAEGRHCRACQCEPTK